MPRSTQTYIQTVLEYRNSHSYAETLTHFAITPKKFAGIVFKAVQLCYEPPSHSAQELITLPPDWNSVRSRDDAPLDILKHVLFPCSYNSLFFMPREYIEAAYRKTQETDVNLPEGILRHPDNLAELLLCSLDEAFSGFRDRSRVERIGLLRTRFSGDTPFLSRFVEDSGLIYAYRAVPVDYGTSPVGLLLLADAYYARLGEEPKMFDTSQKVHLRWWEFPEMGKFGYALDKKRNDSNPYSVKNDLIYHIIETVLWHDVSGYQDAARASSALDRRAAEISAIQDFVIDGSYRANTSLFFKDHGIRFLLDIGYVVPHSSTRALFEAWDCVKADLLRVPSYFASEHQGAPLVALKIKVTKRTYTSRVSLSSARGEEAAK